MGGESSSSKQTVVPKSAAERSLEEVQLEFAREMLGEFRNQEQFQALQRELGTAAMFGLGGTRDPLSALPPEWREDAVREGWAQSIRGGRRANALADIEMQRLASGLGLTPEQDAAIQAVAEWEIASGLGDINRFASQQREAVGTELAPRLGLHRADTPILDRGNRIGAEAVDAASRLVSDIRGRAAQARLDYPLARSQATQGQQALDWSRSDVIADLNQRAFENRLALLGQTSQQGLGLATGYNVPGAQQSMRPTLATETSSAGGGVMFGSSRKIKKILAAPNGPEILKALEKLPVAFWKYLTSDDQREHIGTFAEDFRDAFGLGDGETIDLRDFVGLLLVGLQELAEEVGALKTQEAG